MTRIRLIVLTMLMLLAGMPAVAVAEDTQAPDLDRLVRNVLASGLPAQEAADSALDVIRSYSLHNSMKENYRKKTYRECAEVNVSRLIPFAEKKGVDSELLARIYDSAAQDYLRAGKENVETVRKYNDKALAYARKAESKYLQARILDHRGVLESNYGDTQKGFEYVNEALKLYKECGKDCDRYIVSLLYGQAAIFLRTNDLEGMKNMVDRLAEEAKTARPENRDYVLYNYYSVAGAYYGTLLETGTEKRNQAIVDSINQFGMRTIQLIESSKDDWRGYSVNPRWDYYNRAAFFVNYFDRPPIDSVEYYLGKGADVGRISQANTQAEYEISADRLRAEMWMKLGNFEKAKSILLASVDKLDDSKDINNLISDKCEIYRLLIDISKQSGHYEETVGFMETLSALEHERYDAQRTEAMKDAEVKYRTQETQLALARSEAQRSSTLMWLFAAVGLLLAVVVGFVVYADRQRRRRLLEEIETANLRAEVGRQYIEGLETERTRLAGELHDGVCNDLLAIHRNLSNGGDAEVADGLIQTCYQSVRRISHELMPPEFDYASIDEVLRYYIFRQKEANAGSVEFEYTSESDQPWSAVPEGIALDVYRIFQEAVGNAVKHSGASRISVSLTLVSSELTLRIADNGRFMAKRKSGIGIQSITKRANSLGGKISVSHPDDGGTELILTILV